MNPIPAASAFLLNDLELPRATPTIDNADPAQAQAAAPAGDAGGQLGLDADGVAWDPAAHVAPPRRNASNRWAKKPGNAQRKAKGLPPSGRTFNGAGSAGSAPASAPGEPEPTKAKAEAGPISDLGLGAPAPATGGAGPAPVDAMPEIPLEEYKASGESLSRGFFSTMTLWLGKAWEPDGQELPALAGAVQRVMHHYQLPKVNPLLELITVLIPIFAKRRGDPATKAKVGGLFARFGWGKPKPINPTERPADAEPAPAQAEPAAPTTPAGGGTVTPALRRPWDFAST